MNSKYLIVSVFIFYIILVSWIHFDRFDEFPQRTHAWAQSDRYALVLGFMDNGFDFFHPQTYVMNKQFPDNFTRPSDNRITASDFPIIEYIIAGIIELTGGSTHTHTHNLAVFRIFVFLLSLLGLLFFYKTLLLLTEHQGKALFMFFFVAFSPVFLFYQIGLIPTANALSLTFVGIYFLAKYFKTDNAKYVWWGIVFLTLASLIRLPYSTYIIAFGCYLMLIGLRRFRFRWIALIPVLFSILIISINFSYNTILRSQYGSMFLGDIMVPGSWEELISIVKVIQKKWLFQYFTRYQYILMGAVFIFGVVFGLCGRGTKNYRINFLLYLVIVLVGIFAYALLMFRQFEAHDYYFLDTFFIPIIVSISVIIHFIPTASFKNAVYFYILIVIGLSIPTVLSSKNIYQERGEFGFWNRARMTIENFKGANIFLDSLEIKHESKLLVLDAYAPNIPFILMNRPGYAIMTTSEENIAESFDWDYDFVVYQNEFFLSDIYVNYPQIIDELKIIGSNGKITICQRENTSENISLINWLGIEEDDIIFKDSLIYKSATNSAWKNIFYDDVTYRRNSVGYLSANTDFGMTYKPEEFPYLIGKSRLLLVSGRVLSENAITNSYLVVSIKVADVQEYYKLFDLASFNKIKGHWNDFNLMYFLPSLKDDNYKFAMYIWNQGGNELWYDDIIIELY